MKWRQRKIIKYESVSVFNQQHQKKNEREKSYYSHWEIFLFDLTLKGNLYWNILCTQESLRQYEGN